MQKDFTLNRYKSFLETLLKKGFSFFTIYAYNLHRSNVLHNEEDGVVDKVILLRQDIDRLPKNSLSFARIQKEYGIKSTFYFRVVTESFEPKIIEEIAGMGHEIGYHYEDLSLVAQRLRAEGRGQKGEMQDKRQKYKDKSKKEEAQSSRLRSSSYGGQAGPQAQGEDNYSIEYEKELAAVAIESFERNLEELRRIVPVNSICMHGSPRSRWDSRLLWKYYDYRDFGIDCEPYFDLNFEEMLYLTDTGRRWNGSPFSIRDKGSTNGKAESAESKGDRFEGWVRKPVPGSLMNMREKSTEFQEGYNFRTTNDLIKAAERGVLPDRIMMTFHPQRWSDKTIPWIKELVWQNTKNVAKYFLIKIRQ